MPYQFPLTIKYNNDGEPIGFTETNSVSVSAISATTITIDEAVFDYVSAVSSNITPDLNNITVALKLDGYSGSPKSILKAAYYAAATTGFPALPINAGTILNIAADGSSIEAEPDSFVTYLNLFSHLNGNQGVAGNAIHWQLSTLNSYFVNTSGDTMTGVLNVPGISSVDYIDFDTTAAPAISEGRIRWNDTAKTLEIGSAGSDVFEVGQEVSIRIRNQTGATLGAGTVVYVSGYNSNVPVVGLASASSEGKSHRGMGVVKTAIDDQQRGLMIVKGILSGVNTSGFSAGEIVKLDTVPGKYRSGLTTAPSHNEWIGSVVKVGTGTTDGILFVDIQHGYEIHELHDVSRLSASDGQTLVWNDTSSIYEHKHIYNTQAFTISNPSSVTYKTLFHAKYMRGIESINSFIAGASPSSVGWTLYLASDVTDPEAGTLLLTDTTTSTTVGDETSGVSLSEGWVVLAVDNTNGTISDFHLTIRTY